MSKLDSNRRIGTSSGPASRGCRSPRGWSMNPRPSGGGAGAQPVAHAGRRPGPLPQLLALLRPRAGLRVTASPIRTQVPGGRGPERPGALVGPNGGGGDRDRAAPTRGPGAVRPRGLHLRGLLHALRRRPRGDPGHRSRASPYRERVDRSLGPAVGRRGESRPRSFPRAENARLNVRDGRGSLRAAGDR